MPLHNYPFACDSVNIGKYQIIDTIGSGGMGVVYKALDPRISRTVAIKTIAANLGDDPELRNRLLTEARSAGSLSHKNIITIYEMDEVDGIAYLAMEFLDGWELKEHIIRRTPIPLEQKLRIMLEICEGLAHAHSKGIVHGDIKPGNIFLTRTGQVKILDFGLARLMEAGVATIGTAGTPSYMSPEEVRGEPTDHRSDIFSFGVVCYELLTYSKPFSADSDYAITYKILQSEPDALGSIAPELPPELEPVIARALTKDPAARYPNIEDMLNELELFRLTLDDRKQTLRQQNQDSLSDLERCVSANPELLHETVSHMQELRQLPEVRDGTRSDAGTAWRRQPQLDYLGLVQQRDRIRREREKITALLDRRKRASYLLMEVQELYHGGQLENALQMLNYVIADDPTYREAADLHSELRGRLEEERDRQQRLRQVQEIYQRAVAENASGNLQTCVDLLTEVLSLHPGHAEARALLDSSHERMREQERQRETRIQEALASGQHRLEEGDITGARGELAQAVELGAPGAMTAELAARIERAGQEYAAREQRLAERRSRVAALVDSARQALAAGTHTDAVRIGNEALALDPECAEAVEIRKHALAALEAESTVIHRRAAGEREKIAGFKLLGEGKYRESRAALKRAAEWLGEDPVILVGIEEADAGIRQQELQGAVESGLLEARQLTITDAWDAAAEQVNRVLALSPRNQEALALLAKIEEGRQSRPATEPVADVQPEKNQPAATELSAPALNDGKPAPERSSRLSPALLGAIVALAAVVVLLIYFLLIRK
jgi:serine/threonine protein kinase